MSFASTARSIPLNVHSSPPASRRIGKEKQDLNQTTNHNTEHKQGKKSHHKDRHGHKHKKHHDNAQSRRGFFFHVNPNRPSPPLMIVMGFLLFIVLWYALSWIFLPGEGLWCLFGEWWGCPGTIGTNAAAATSTTVFIVPAGTDVTVNNHAGATTTTTTTSAATATISSATGNVVSGLTTSPTTTVLTSSNDGTNSIPNTVMYNSNTPWIQHQQQQQQQQYGGTAALSSASSATLTSTGLVVYGQQPNQYRAMAADGTSRLPQGGTIVSAGLYKVKI